MERSSRKGELLLRWITAEDACAAIQLRAKGPSHTSLGQRPRTPAKREKRHRRVPSPVAVIKRYGSGLIQPIWSQVPALI